jgi:V/A-type H+-transporting ATPase subunit A
LDQWFKDNAPKGWTERRQEAVDLLQQDAELQEIVQLVGPDALQEQERLVLELSRMVKEVFLQQNAFSDDDAYSSLEKTGGLLDALMSFYDECKLALDAGVLLMSILDDPVKEEISRLREVNSDGFVPKKDIVMNEMKAAVQKLIEAVG